MRHPTWSVTLIVLAVLVATSYAPADTVVLQVKHQDAARMAQCLPELIKSLAPRLGILEGELTDVSAAAVLERNELKVSGPGVALELARKVVGALDVRAQLVWLKAVIVRTENPAEILRLPASSSITVAIDGEPITIPYAVLGLPPPIPRDETTLVCISNPDVACLERAGAPHRLMAAPQILSMSRQKATLSAAGVRGLQYEVAFVPSVLPDGSISVALHLYHQADVGRPNEIELAYVARDGQPWAFALLHPPHDEEPTTVFVVTVSTAELK